MVLCSSPETLSRKLWKKYAGAPVFFTRSNEPCHVPKFELPDNAFKPKKIHNIECNPKSNRLLKFTCKLMPPHHFTPVYSVAPLSPVLTDATSGIHYDWCGWEEAYCTVFIWPDSNREPSQMPPSRNPPRKGGGLKKQHSCRKFLWQITCKNER